MRATPEPGDFRTGVLVLLAAALVIAGLVWVSPMRGPQPIEFYTELPELAHVSLETPVMLNGFQVGQVNMVEPSVAADGRVHFRIGMAITWQARSTEQTPYRSGMRVRITRPALDVFGGGTLDLEPSPAPGVPLLPGSVLLAVSDVPMMAKADERIDSLSRQVAQTLSESRQMMIAFRKTADASSSTIRGAGEITAAVNQNLASLSSTTLAAILRADSALQGLARLQAGATNTTDSLNALLGDSRRALSQVSAMLGTTGPKLDAAMANLDETSDILSHFVRSISERPARILTGVTPPPPRARRDSGTSIP